MRLLPKILRGKWEKDVGFPRDVGFSKTQPNLHWTASGNLQKADQLRHSIFRRNDEFFAFSAFLPNGGPFFSTLSGAMKFRPAFIGAAVAPRRRIMKLYLAVMFMCRDVVSYSIIPVTV